MSCSDVVGYPYPTFSKLKTTEHFRAGTLGLALLTVMSTLFASPAIPMIREPLPVFQGHEPVGATATYHIADLRVLGAKSLGERKALAIARLKTGKVVHDIDIQRGVDRLLKECRARGLIDAKVSLDRQVLLRQPGQKYPGINLNFTLAEGPRYFIGYIEFHGNLKTSHMAAEHAAGLHLYEPYNPEAVKRWIQGLNRSGHFQQLTPDDVQVTVIDKDRHWMLVSFHVRDG